jgi:hypothetical protein
MQTNRLEEKREDTAVTVSLEELASELALVRGGQDAPVEETTHRCHCGSMCKGK